MRVPVEERRGEEESKAAAAAEAGGDRVPGDGGGGNMTVDGSRKQGMRGRFKMCRAMLSAGCR